MNDAMFLLMMLMAAFPATWFISVYLTETAMVKTVMIFRHHQADDVWSAKTADELGLGPKGFLERVMAPWQNFKPFALGVLMNTRIIRKTGRGKLYLSEKRLSDFCSRNENPLKVY